MQEPPALPKIRLAVSLKRMRSGIIPIAFTSQLSERLAFDSV